MATNVLRDDAKKTWEKLQTLRDEVRLKIHLAGMDAKDEWNRLEQKMPELESQVGRTAEDLGEVTRSALETSISDAIRRLEKVRASLEKR